MSESSIFYSSSDSENHTDYILHHHMKIHELVIQTKLYVVYAILL